MRPLNILLLYKMSMYQYHHNTSSACHSDSVEKGRFEETHKIHYQALQHVEDVLHEYHLTYHKVARGQLDDYSAFDMVITVGGDGTFLEAARYIGDQLILGVNSDPSWSVGRLCSANAEHFRGFIDDMLSDRSRVVPLNRLCVSFDQKWKSVFCVNDILVAHINPASLSRYMIRIGHDCEEQRSSGIWLSTAAGSTGAIHSAGGSILDLMSEDFQYMPRELYRGWKQDAYRLTGGVLSKQTTVEITSLMTEGMLFIDGSHQRIPFLVSERVTISQADTPLSMIQRRSS